MIRIMGRVTFELPLLSNAITMCSNSLVPGDLGDQSLSEDEDEGVEGEKSRWKEVDVEKRVKMEHEMLHHSSSALLPDSHQDL